MIGALAHALNRHAVPDIVHSEYDRADYVGLVQTVGAQLCMSAKGASWQNAYKESFYSHLKAEAGGLNQFDTLGELVEFIYQQIGLQLSPQPFSA